MAKLQLQNLNKTYSPKNVPVKDISLDVSEGEFLTLLGPSGCGKTTTLRLVAGFAQAAARRGRAQRAGPARPAGSPRAAAGGGAPAAGLRAARGLEAGGRGAGAHRRRGHGAPAGLPPARQHRVP